MHRWSDFGDLTASMAEMCLQFLGKWKATKTIAAEMLGILFVVARLTGKATEAFDPAVVWLVILLE